MPRIALIVPSFPVLSETFVVNKFLGLLEQGWDVHVVCATSNPFEWERFPQLKQREDAHERVHVSWPVEPRYRAALAYPWAVTRTFAHQPAATSRYFVKGVRQFGARTFRRIYLDAYIIALKPDLIHFEFGALAHGRMYLRNLIDCRTVVSFRGYDLNYAGLEDKAYYYDVWKYADAIHVLSQDLWDKALRRGAPPEKLHTIIPPAIDTSFFQAGVRHHTDICGSVDRPLQILSVGRLVWIKGYEYAVEAIRLLRDRGIVSRYTIIGEGPFRDAIGYAMDQFGVRPLVRLLGARSPDEVKADMLEADVMLHSAVSEGFCNAVLEAQAMSLPVVSSDAGGLGENVIDGQTGFVVPRRDPASLAEKLARLAENPGLRESMGHAGRGHAETNFRLQDQIQRFDSLYREILDEDTRDGSSLKDQGATNLTESHDPGSTLR